MIEYKKAKRKYKATAHINGVVFGSKLCFTKRGAKRDLIKMMNEYGGYTNEETKSIYKRGDNKQGKL